MGAFKLFLRLIFLLYAGVVLGQAGPDLIANGHFEAKGSDGLPKGWAATKKSGVQQHLEIAPTPGGQSCVKLGCTSFSEKGTNCYTGILQTNKISIRRGHWYRCSFWARGERIHFCEGRVALGDVHQNGRPSLDETFGAGPEWMEFDFTFPARSNLSPANSLLQFWFAGTGVLWLKDVELREYSGGKQWYPQIETDEVKNFIPNSSFECGTANWGSYDDEMNSPWFGNLFRLEGQLDAGTAPHGKNSFKIALGPDTEPVRWFDYRKGFRQPIRRVLLANQGWFHVRPGESLTLSAFLRADSDNLAADMVVKQNEAAPLRHAVMVGTQWKRYEFTFHPTQPFLFIALGPDLEASGRVSGTLWIDAIQLERGANATSYEPRQPLESFIDTDAIGNIFSNAARGITINIRAFNDTGTNTIVRGKLALLDFFNRASFVSGPELNVPPHSGSSSTVNNICAGQYGFFRARWWPAASGEGEDLPPNRLSQSLRCAIIDPIGAVIDAPLGFNHAYPWDFLTRLARETGILWFRNWSAAWEVVEPQKGQFDFSIPDQQITRTLNLGGKVDVLLPFPSAPWSTSGDKEELKKRQFPGFAWPVLWMAAAPKDPKDFDNYAAETVLHYNHNSDRAINTYQILNEPGTSYSLPAALHYKIQDYVSFLKHAYPAIKKADPQCRVIGGTAGTVDSPETLQLVDEGGLKWLDILDMHVYDRRSAEEMEPAFEKLVEAMRSRGGPKELWMTEYGCYSEDDPACVPYDNDESISGRTFWSNERVAAENVIKFTAISFAYGMRKIFFHAGVSGALNAPHAGGVLFEFGGAPRKIYPAIAPLTKLLGVPREVVAKIEQDGLKAFIFRCDAHATAIIWADAEQIKRLELPSQVQAFDIMGNEFKTSQLTLDNSPVYLTSSDAKILIKTMIPN